MKRSLVAGSALLAVSAIPAVAEQHTFSPADCSELAGSPYVCLYNHKDVGIKKIHCPGWHTNAQNIPGGVIDPGEIVIIKFGTSRCDSKMIITFSDEHQQEIEGFDTNKNVILHIK